MHSYVGHNNVVDIIKGQAHIVLPVIQTSHPAARIHWYNNYYLYYSTSDNSDNHSNWWQQCSIHYKRRDTGIYTNYRPNRPAARIQWYNYYYLYYSTSDNSDNHTKWWQHCCRYCRRRETDIYMYYRLQSSCFLDTVVNWRTERDQSSNTTTTTTRWRQVYII